ncbi:hypothetical protein EG832_09115, partial [bacterium]|nr:hypothetical protein [bacterium]
MQKVVEVACSSPPVVVNATKPAAQAVQVANQDPFDLVLQKASEKIVKNNQNEDASRCSESKSTDHQNGSETTANNRVADTKKEREVVKPAKSEKSERSDKAEKAEKLEEDDKVKEKDTDPNTIVYGYVTSSPASEENLPQVNLQGGATPGDIGTDVVESSNVMQAEMNSSTQSDAEVAQVSGSLKEAAMAAIAKNTETMAVGPADEFTAAEGQNLETAIVETDPKNLVSGVLNKGAKVDEKITTELKPVNTEPNGKTSDAGKVNVSTSTNDQGDSVINIARVYQESASTPVVTGDKVGKTAEVDVSQQTAPPDNPNGSAVTAASAAGTTASARMRRVY